MSVINTLVLFGCAIFTVCDARFVDTLQKCSAMDFDCQKGIITSIMTDFKSTGIAELGIPPVDPYVFKGVNVSVVDLLDVTIVEGQISGISNCVIDSYKNYLEKGQTDLAVTCNNLQANAKYALSASNSLIKDLLKGLSVQGDGNGKVKIEQVKIKFHFFYDLLRKKDGDIYFEPKIDKNNFVYDITGKVTFDSDKLFTGEADSTQRVLEYMNNNYKVIVNTFGRTVADVIGTELYEIIKKFFHSVPAKYIFIDDLSNYVKN